MYRRRCLFFFFNDTATTEIYTLSLHDALPISSHDLEARSPEVSLGAQGEALERRRAVQELGDVVLVELLECVARSEEHTSELQSRQYLVCRLLLEKKKHNSMITNSRRLQTMIT